MLSPELSAALDQTDFYQLYESRVFHQDTVMIRAIELPAAIFDEVVRRHGPGIVHVCQKSSVVIPAEEVAALFIERRHAQQRPLSASASPLVDKNSDASWLATTLAQEKREAHQRQTECEKIAKQWGEKPEPEKLPASKRSPDPLPMPEGAHLLVNLDALEVEYRALGEEPKDLRRKELLEALRHRPWRILKRAHRQHLKVLAALQVDFPNFADVIEQLRVDLQLQIRLQAPLRFAPLLLLGPPGVGKTAFARELATRIGFVYEEQSIASMTASFVLTGSHQTWGGSEIGLIARHLIDLKDQQGVFFLLDELDKLQEGTRNYSPNPVLLSVLEHKQAQRFRDEYLALPFDIEPIFTWLATANDIRKVPAPLLSRLQIQEIRPPLKEEMPAVMRSIDRGVRDAKPQWKTIFAPLGANTLKAMETLGPREAGAVLRAAYGLALSGGNTRGKVQVRPADVAKAIEQRRRVEEVKPESPASPEGVMAMTWIVPIPGNSSGGSTPPVGTVH